VRGVILLTGATGNVGSALLRRLTADGERVRCLVRDPRRLGPERVRVQIALGDLSDPSSFRNAMRGVSTVVHLAAAMRDQPRGSIEELNGVATYRLVRAAERAGAERFVFFSAIGASEHAPTRLFRAKALAEQTVAESSVPSTIFAPSIVYAPDDKWMRQLRRLTWLPALPVSGSGRAAYQPIWAEDVADCVRAVLDGHRDGDARERYELAGPETLSYDQIARIVLRSTGRRRRLLHVPLPVVRRGLNAAEALAGRASPVTWDEAELLEAPMIAERGTADAQALGVTPLAMREVLAVG
jgi:NADH dehydrogenase